MRKSQIKKADYHTQITSMEEGRISVIVPGLISQFTPKKDKRCIVFITNQGAYIHEDDVVSIKDQKPSALYAELSTPILDILGKMTNSFYNLADIDPVLEEKLYMVSSVRKRPRTLEEYEEEQRRLIDERLAEYEEEMKRKIQRLHFRMLTEKGDIYFPYQLGK